MNHSIELPKWLDSIIFNDFEAQYKQCPDEVQYGPDQGLEHLLVYLGTYFPRSYVECYCIVEHLLENERFNKTLYDLEEINIADFCCGTGGELLGAIIVCQTQLPNLRRINIEAFDANPWAIRILSKMFNEILPQVQEVKVDVNLTPKPIFVENEQYLQDVANMLNRDYHLILSFKALNEFVQGETFGQDNVYTIIAQVFAPRLTDSGILLLLDVSSRNNRLGHYYPEIMNEGINKFVKLEDKFKTIIPQVCYHREGSCPSCYMQDTFYITHSQRTNDVSKVAYRILCRKKLADELMADFSNIPICRATHPNASKSIPYQNLLNQ